MLGYEFKTYLSGGREYLMYRERDIGDTDWTRRDFTFPDNLIALLYLDIWQYESLTKKAERTLEEYYETKDERCATTVMEVLDEIADVHPYFELLRLDWKYRFERVKQNEYRGIVDLLPRKMISHIPSTIDTMQKQIEALFAAALDIDGEKKPVSEKLAEYYRRAGDRAIAVFQFQPCSMNFEVLDSKTFAEVLYPKTVYDLIDFSVRECIKREVRMRVCKNCGRYFTFTGRSSAEYCNRVCDEKGRTCKEMGASLTWLKGHGADEVFKEYRREYKKRFARLRRGNGIAEDFYAWGERAREKLAECESGKLSYDEFSEWLKNS